MKYICGNCYNAVDVEHIIMIPKTTGVASMHLTYYVAMCEDCRKKGKTI